MAVATPFPTSPSDVAALTVPEFMRALQLDASVSSLSIDAVCGRFLDDANRALVWLIRFRALAAWCERTDTALWLHSDPSHKQDACELAASFDLNDDWGFDAERFRSAVESIGRRRGRGDRGAHA